jgi:hypothetical protein
MLYLFVFLKLPILFACGIVWWAVKQGTDTDDVSVRSDGGTPIRPRPHPRRPRHPRPPRRGGPHAAGARMASPPRIRSVTAAGRARELEH